MFFGNSTQVEEQFELTSCRGSDVDPTNAIERFEVAGKALGEARQRNREEGFAIIVEGPRDKSALQRLGFEGPIEVVNRGWGMDRLVAVSYTHLTLPTTPYV